MARSGALIIVSGPSGAGKSALVNQVMRRIPGLRFSVSYTTRAPRGNERDSVEYFFVDRNDFRSLIEKDELLEWAEVHGNYYGTSRSFVEETTACGKDVVLDIDVQGARIVREKCAESIAVLILPPSYEVLRQRLRNRGLDDEQVIEKRLRIAGQEISRYREYDYVIVNDDLDSSMRELESIIVGARCRMTARIESAEAVVATFGGLDAEDS